MSGQTDTVVEITLTAIAHGGEALTRHQGKVIFVAGAIPGEQVRAQIVDEHKRWARARLLELLTPSPDRVQPPCPYLQFDPNRPVCGGCQWQHIAYERQLALKQEIVADQLRRLGHVENPPVQETLAVGEEDVPDAWGYRNYAQFVIASDGHPGFYAAGSHDVVPIRECLILHPLLNEMLESLEVKWTGLRRLGLRAGVHTGDRLVVLETTHDQAPELEVDVPISCALLRRDGMAETLIGQAWYNERILGRQFRVSAGSFFQVNTPGAEALVGLVGEMLSSRPGDVLLDVYCGVGLFGLSLADQVTAVVGVEESASACDDFEFNAQEMDNASLYEGPAEEVLPALVRMGERATLAVLDPPRSGAGAAVIETLSALGVRRLAYVSCDPATLARDAAALCSMGYQLVTVQPLDMFPQTYHVESVALWEL